MDGSPLEDYERKRTVQIRVRALIHINQNAFIAIKRTRPGQSPYWVLPGGQVEDTDTSLEEALSREVIEELGEQNSIGECRPIIRLDDSSYGTQIIYSAQLEGPFDSSSVRTGPEFSDPDRGSYDLEKIPADVASVGPLFLQPQQLKMKLLQALSNTNNLCMIDQISSDELPRLTA